MTKILARTIGTIQPGSLRADDWMRIFGRLSVPLVSPAERVAVVASRVADLELTTVLELDVAALDLETRGRLVEHLARSRDLTRTFVEDALARHGCPVAAGGVTVEDLKLEFAL